MKTLKEILFWIIAILFLGMFTCFFSSCSDNIHLSKENYYVQYQKLILNGNWIYKLVDDEGCMWLSDPSTEALEHHPTCNNPKHSCACYNEVYE